MSVALEPIQSGSGDPSPENVRPISGRTEVNLGRTGSNYWNKDYTGIGANIVYKPVNVGEGTFTLYTDTPVYGEVGCCMFLLAGNVNTGAGNTTNGAYKGSPRTQTAVGGYVTIAFRILEGIDPRSYDSMLVKTADVQDITIALGTTVYGGTLDVKTGVLTVTHVLQTFNGSENEWFKSGVTACDVFCIINNDYVLDASTLLNRFTYNDSKNYNQVGYAWYDGERNQLRIGFSDYGETTLEQFKTWLGSNNLQLCYKLATPTTVQLTPAQLMMLKGYNSLSTDGGDVITVTAYAINEEVGA